MKLHWHPEAQIDLEEIWDYSAANWGSVRADAYLTDIRVKAEALTRDDLSGAKADDIGAGLRRQVVGAHVIWFRVEGERLRVIRVLHQSRDVGRWVG